MPWMLPAAIVGGNLVGGMMQGDAAKQAAEKSAQAQLEAARIGAEAARFTPVGVTSRFGQSNFGYDETGRLNAAGYTMSPELQAQQDYMMQMANRGLDQYGMGQQYAQPMLGASQTMMGLGEQYLGQSPEEQAQKYMAAQQGLLAPSRTAQLSNVRQDLFNKGRTGLAVGGENGTLATNPEMAAYYNSIAQQDAQLAAQAEQQGQNYAKFGASMMGLGGDMLGGYYGAQSQAMNPYQQALGAAQSLEAMGQGTMDIGSSLGAKQSTAGATQGQLLATGGMNAARTQQSADAYSPWGSMLSGASNAMMPYAMNQAFNQPQQGMFAGGNPASYGGGYYTGTGNEISYGSGLSFP